MNEPSRSLMDLAAARRAVERLGYEGIPIACSREEWHEGTLRLELQRAVGHWIDGKQDIRASLALQELARLDRLYGLPEEEKP